LYFIAGAFDDAEKAFLKVIDLSGSDREAQAIAYGNLGVLYKARNEWDKTLSTLRTSIINPKAG
jgi:tetratricopeptide (TPR) repeat protein